jgi:propanol-preferring alcohol dehydrogenase
MRVRALRLTAWKSDPQLVEVPEPVPGPGEVVVRVGGAGACHSDLHLLYEFEDGTLPYGPPFTLGHENAGWVHAVGDGVEDVAVGQAVAVFGSWSCGRCARCRVGMENYCEDPASAKAPGGGGGLGWDGGMADFMLVPHSRLLVPLPDGLAPAQAAPLADAGLTPYHAVTRSRQKLGAGRTAVVIGVGGLGHIAVQLLKVLTPATVVAIDRREQSLALARRFGADHAVLAGDGAVDAVRDLTRGQGADVVLDFVGVDQSLATAARMARALGDITIVGVGGGSVPVGFFRLANEVSVQTMNWGSLPELREVLDLAAAGKLMPVITTYALDEAPEVYARLARGEIEGRAVIVPQSG